MVHFKVKNTISQNKFSIEGRDNRIVYTLRSLILLTTLHPQTFPLIALPAQHVVGNVASAGVTLAADL